MTKNVISNSCQLKSSKIGAKNFFYPCDDQTGLFVRKGTEVDILPYLSGRDNENLQAVAIANELVEGAVVSEGIGVYWVDRKNLS